ncbi:hypothetical protein [Oceanobacillus massiliensis]|uniref:hypothetical protein n=1 Tax=Oceanobacillus massiliensis TaxID=1465765 RepID=UPI000287DB5D|nr:hypothetical protein [Oceanobacillus massiliensis]
MAVLPTADLGIMADHLSAHEGVLQKLRAYQKAVTNQQLRNIMRLQENIMQSHVWVMLALINPENNNYVEVPPLQDLATNYPSNPENNEKNSDNKWIALEVRNTANNMSSTNFNSALMMQNPNVIHAHIEMALQQHQIMKMYDEFIESMGWKFIPHATAQEQLNTYFHFQHQFQHLYS